MTDYANLTQPPLAPPPTIFPIVWAILYVLMGISAALIYRSASGEDLRRALWLWGAQLFVNMFWSLFYFRLEWRLFAFYWLALLIVLVVLMFRRFRPLRPAAAYLNIPYIAWLAFAAYLNLATWYLNK